MSVASRIKLAIAGFMILILGYMLGNDTSDITDKVMCTEETIVQKWVAKANITDESVPVIEAAVPIVQDQQISSANKAEKKEFFNSRKLLISSMQSLLPEKEVERLVAEFSPLSNTEIKSLGNRNDVLARLLSIAIEGSDGEANENRQVKGHIPYSISAKPSSAYAEKTRVFDNSINTIYVNMDLTNQDINKILIKTTDKYDKIATFQRVHMLANEVDNYIGISTNKFKGRKFKLKLYSVTPELPILISEEISMIDKDYN